MNRPTRIEQIEARLLTLDYDSEDVKWLASRVRELETVLRPFVQMSYPPDKQLWTDCRNWANAALGPTRRDA